MHQCKSRDNHPAIESENFARDGNTGKVRHKCHADRKDRLCRVAARYPAPSARPFSKGLLSWDEILIPNPQPLATSH